MKFIKRKSALKPITGSIVDTFNINDKVTNTYSARIIDNLVGSGSGVDISQLVDVFYPVGRGFIDFTDTDYSNWLGLTWERELLGVTPIGYKDGDADFGTVGKTGGEKTHTLTVNEMPSHTHIQNAHTHTQNSHAHNVTMQFGPSTSKTTNVYGGNAQIKEYSGRTFATAGATATNQNTTATNQNTGGSQAHNNLPPYQVVSYWKRVDPNAKTMISFTIDGTSYQAEEGMTWYDWCNSDYNTSVWVCSSPTETTIYFGDSQEDYLALEAGYKPTKCTASDVIIANYAYGTGTSSK